MVKWGCSPFNVPCRIFIVPPALVRKLPLVFWVSLHQDQFFSPEPPLVKISGVRLSHYPVTSISFFFSRFLFFFLLSTFGFRTCHTGRIFLVLFRNPPLPLRSLQKALILTYADEATSFYMWKSFSVPLTVLQVYFLGWPVYWCAIFCVPPPSLYGM